MARLTCFDALSVDASINSGDERATGVWSKALSDFRVAQIFIIMILVLPERPTSAYAFPTYVLRKSLPAHSVDIPPP
jgi:hypothetical protein